MDTPPTLPQELWDRIPPEVRAYIETLKGQVKTLTSMVHTLQEQVRTLQEQLNQTSRNSSRPPSSDPPQSQRLRRPRGQRRRGGQPGHPGHTRSLVLWKRSMRWSSSHPISVAVATRPYRETMPHRFVSK